MYSGEGSMFLILGAAGLVWMFVLSVIVWKNTVFLKKLFPDKTGDFKEKLEESLRAVERVESFRKKNLENVQKVYLKRYNPYHDTGGDQSFSVSLLDGHGNGLVITSLHSRSGTRVFAKPVKGGKEGGFEFSEEEKAVVEKAILGKNN
ncbi:MAG: DUF4446 family protein [Microgenomates group bacterium]|jgi:hypothetical protein